MSQITLILERLNRGENEAFEDLVPLVYQELRRRAYRRLGSAQAARDGHTLQPTALVHEAYLKLAGGNASAWQDSRHFYNAAAEVMKQIVLNHARAGAAQKRGGGRQRVELEGVEAVVPSEQTDWEALDRALAELRALDERRYQVVMLRYFAGLTDAQVAAALGVSEKTVERDWKAAKLFLRGTMREQTADR
jgi:RNA polymerase sigma factor (TIGR02999 family)